LARTLDVFSRAAEWVARGRDSFPDRAIGALRALSARQPARLTIAWHADEALLSLFSNIDAPVAPSDKGNALVVRGLTHELRQQARDRLLAVDRKVALP
jgi:hypothetical protein